MVELSSQKDEFHVPPAATTTNTKKKQPAALESPPVGIGHALQRHSSTFPAVFCRPRSLKHVYCKLT